MRRRTSFAAPAQPPVRLLTALIWLVAIALGLWAWDSWARMSELRKNTAQLSARLTALAAAEADTPAAPAPSAEALSALVADIDRLNALTGPRPAPLTAVLEGLEALVPEGVWISQMVWSADAARLNLSLQSGAETNLPAALSAIEAAPFLTAVILERQIRVQQGRNTLVQYDIEAALR